MFERQNTDSYIADLYIRLSDEDERDGLSGSCEAQEMLLKDYCFKNNIFIHKIHIDDGWSGTNFAGVR